MGWPAGQAGPAWQAAGWWPWDPLEVRPLGGFVLHGCQRIPACNRRFRTLGLVKSSGPIARLEQWPELPYTAWKDPLDTLHMTVQIRGKVRLSPAPFEPPSAHRPLYLCPRRLNPTP